LIHKKFDSKKPQKGDIVHFFIFQLSKFPVKCKTLGSDDNCEDVDFKFNGENCICTVCGAKVEPQTAEKYFWSKP
jgi:hypothetical protein